MDHSAIARGAIELVNDSNQRKTVVAGEQGDPVHHGVSNLQLTSGVQRSIPQSDTKGVSEHMNGTSSLPDQVVQAQEDSENTCTAHHERHDHFTRARVDLQWHWKWEEDILPKCRDYKSWSKEGEHVLKAALANVGPNWRLIVAQYCEHGFVNDSLRGRDNKSRLGKARCMKEVLIGTGKEIPAYLQKVAATRRQLPKRVRHSYRGCVQRYCAGSMNLLSVDLCGDSDDDDQPLVRQATQGSTAETITATCQQQTTASTPAPSSNLRLLEWQNRRWRSLSVRSARCGFPRRGGVRLARIWRADKQVARVLVHQTL